jgi:hypothetical protein
MCPVLATEYFIHLSLPWLDFDNGVPPSRAAFEVHHKYVLTLFYELSITYSKSLSLILCRQLSHNLPSAGLIST